MSHAHPYPSDLSDAEVGAPCSTLAAAHTVRPPTEAPGRLVIDGVFYVLRADALLVMTPGMDTPPSAQGTGLGNRQRPAMLSDVHELNGGGRVHISPADAL